MGARYLRGAIMPDYYLIHTNFMMYTSTGTVSRHDVGAPVAGSARRSGCGAGPPAVELKIIAYISMQGMHWASLWATPIGVLPLLFATGRHLY